MLKYYDLDGNLIDTVKPEDIPGLTVSFLDDTGLLEIHEPYKFIKSKIIVGKKCTVKIGPNSTIKESLTILTKNRNNITIGKNFNVRSAELICRSEPNIQISIGDDFLGSSQIIFRASDAHTVYSLDSKKPINEPRKGIFVGNHVWMGQRVTVLKDATIPDNCVISFGALVTAKEFSENSIIAGVPARVIKTNINWSSYNTANYKSLFSSEFTDVEDMPDSFDSAVSLYKKGEYRKALKLFLDIRKKANNHLMEIDRCIAMCFMRLKKHNLARIYFDSALRNESYQHPLTVAASLFNSSCLNGKVNTEFLSELKDLMPKDKFMDSVLMARNFYEKLAPDSNLLEDADCKLSNFYYNIEKKNSKTKTDCCYIFVQPLCNHNHLFFNKTFSCDVIYLSQNCYAYFLPFLRSLIKQFSEKIEGYKKVVLSSSSAGGYCTLLLGYELAKKHPEIQFDVLAFAPQVDLNDPEVTYSHRKCLNAYLKYGFIKKNYDKLSNLSEYYHGSEVDNLNIKLFYGEKYKIDARQSQLLSKYSFIQLIPIANCDSHDVMKLYRYTADQLIEKFNAGLLKGGTLDKWLEWKSQINNAHLKDFLEYMN